MADLTIRVFAPRPCVKCNRMLQRNEQAIWDDKVQNSIRHIDCNAVVEPGVITTKSISLHFEVPVSLDTPSEVLAEMKQIILEALDYRRIRKSYSPDATVLVHALLTES